MTGIAVESFLRLRCSRHLSACRSELKATAETELEQANVDLDTTKGEIEVLAKYAGDVHKACDFVRAQFFSGLAQGMFYLYRL